jgi:putative DNA methylase
LRRHSDLYTPRQLVALTTFCDLVAEARERVRRDAIAAGLPDDPTPLDAGGIGAQAYADAVATYLAFAVDRSANYWSSLSTWHGGRETMQGVFARQALPMVWDYAEGNPLSTSTGNMRGSVEWVAKVLELVPACSPGDVKQLDAASTIDGCAGTIVSTDPPYYDNISYADLSDFFYVWLRRCLGAICQDLFATLLVPKSQELIAAPHRFGGDREAARIFFEGGIGSAFRLIGRCHEASVPITIYYAYKQSEEEQGAEASITQVASTGWETMLEALLRSGLAITGTWPMRTEMEARALGRMGTNALASSIVLVCRPRPEDAPMATRREFTSALRHELPLALKQLTHAGIAPVDLAQATIGPGMAVFSRYSKVLEADGSPMTVRTALQIINQELDAYLTEQEGDLDGDTRFCIAWFEQYGLNEAAFGEADVLARAKNSSVAGIEAAGVLHARAGKVQLRARSDYPEDWDPQTDRRLTVWECTQHLICELERKGEEGAAALVRRLGGGMSEDARALAYRLYAIADRKHWTEEARAYNSLVVSWPAIVEKAARAPGAEQGRLLE